MRYRRLKGYKYQLAQSYSCDLPEAFNGIDCDTPYIIIVNNRLLIKQNYAWDGPSGPTFDTKNFIRGSLVHDALYQMIRAGKLIKVFRVDADQLLRKICRDDGMNRFRAWYVYSAVRLFAAGAIKPKIETFNEIIEI